MVRPWSRKHFGGAGFRNRRNLRPAPQTGGDFVGSGDGAFSQCARWSRAIMVFFEFRK
jgi:hypothetical protein